MAKLGHPTSYTPEKANAICRRIAEGESLRSVCRDKAMPAYSTAIKWLAEKAAFSDQYAKQEPLKKSRC